MIVGTTYLERGIPVVVLIAWKGPCPRNVLIRRLDGTRVVRPFRGLRRAPEIPPAALAVARSAEALPPCQQAGGQSHQEDHPHPGHSGRSGVLELRVGGSLRQHEQVAAGEVDPADPPVLRLRLCRDHDGLHRPSRVGTEPESGELDGFERRIVRFVPDQRHPSASVEQRPRRVDLGVLRADERPRAKHPVGARALPAGRSFAVGRWLLTLTKLDQAAAPQARGCRPSIRSPW